ncbi:Inherit from COG: Zinc phosphodiesterase [Seminavis robusta]|uniref:Inherit from COG: Zinc phosphodiesterase n=1 Tax=Seminavis robusta TaxID=568900 RepID=A0A9N8HIW6_9STRA|nr:Inherit from COG: Zinc phosphodiesterase [Seminavis robusta]|eukprot:Sro650_g181480.1 Inherit from COG: Zinc phosphodiesterase (316) ;mRNA; r:52320-53267
MSEATNQPKDAEEAASTKENPRMQNLKLTQASMDPLKVKMSHWQKKLVIPGTPWDICGYSRSAYRTGFYIAALDMLLDAGPQHFGNPTHILITHTHIDHCACLPFTLIGDESHQPHIYAVAKAGPRILQYVSGMFSVNAMEDCDASPFYTFHGLEPHSQFQLTTKKTDLEIQVFECDHPIPTISYGFAEKKHKLKSEYLKLPGKEIGKLRKEGVEITQEVVQKKFAYVCDTSIDVFALNPSILAYPVVFIECTFLWDDELENAIQTKHVHWSQLKPIVEQHPGIVFVAFHFSQRYRDDEIEEFFAKENMPNVIWW